MNSGLKYLTSDDYSLLIDKAEVVIYDKDDVILQEGCACQSIYILKQGLLKVERATSGMGFAIAFLQPGEIFGEMSFLGEVATSAQIIAETEVEVFIITKTVLDSLLKSSTELSNRFYQSLAYNLSNRLRATSSLVSCLMKRFGCDLDYESKRTGYQGHDNIPPELIGEVELFKQNLLEVERNLRLKKIEEESAQEVVNRVCKMVINAMREQIIDNSEQENAIGTYLFRETFPFLMLSSFVDLAFRKSRSYHNDSYITEVLSQNEPEGDGHLGIYIDRWIRSIPTCLALKNRGSIIAKTVKELSTHWAHKHPMPVTSIASGSANEILDLYLHANPPHVHVTCIDTNHQRLAYAANLSRKLEFDDHITFIQDNIFLLAQGSSNISIPPQQMIYSLTMGNYLKDQEFVVILDWIYDHLLPEGTVILGNFNTYNPDRPLLKHILEWNFTYRSIEQLEDLFASSKFSGLPIKIEADEFGVELFVICNKC
ncbi:cyclic nucleotide-binding protein [Xenococcus sp. PCC 7305]|uniref:cyclic nucleotide-binding domain-containing protein n=1 Tax=Xenococcus sp. PCC 7305 TaxID=102125 RepID=UPI0002AD005F|nr:cyclic nucleotide-binding domain-containing protein [Xenococcus sp. PCC 7305]ELS02613.1 cyclic nucleotide-binding protein [Xenococcus sp. PCC 7305]